LGAFSVFFRSRIDLDAAQSDDSIRRGYRDDTAALMRPDDRYRHAQAMRRLALCFFAGYQLERSKWPLVCLSEPRHYVLDSRVTRWVSLMACRRAGRTPQVPGTHGCTQIGV
jgi:hypothetical protein